MTARPTNIALAPDGKLRIDFNDGSRREYTVRELRDGCPCATCREKHGAKPAAAPLLPVLSAAEARPLTLAAMTPVGNYAYALEFSDGHDSGIYTFELLAKLGRATD